MFMELPGSIMFHNYEFWFITEAQERIHIFNYVYNLDGRIS